MIFNNKENLNSGFTPTPVLDKTGVSSSKLERGFTLIELIVAIGLFATVMTISIGAFLNVSDIQKKSEAMRNVSENISFSIEMMIRDIREGTEYSCGSSSSCSEFSFTETKANGESVKVTYKLEGGQIKRNDSINDSIITSDDVSISNLIFTVSGNSLSGKDGQPFVTIYVGGVTDSKEKLKSSLNLQASVSQRKIDSGL